ncbi:copper transport protein ctr1 [Actinomortierella ambigua]|nr:copper transport protein ctr1 [Actinomortierella ambigua]
MEANPSSAQSLLVLENRLGSGTFGVVHQALYGDQPCAAKAFFVTQSELDRKTIDKEISVLQRLRFRHVIQFYRTHEQNNHTYILMELAEKGSLAQAITKRHLACDDWVTKTRLAHEIALGLAYIHQEGVLHRDLKSANVLLTKHMEVKLADFGLAQVRSMASAASSASGQASKGAAGTLRWLAPELLYAATPMYSTKSDVYALGVVMWEMAADCTKPFRDQHDDALVTLGVKHGHREQLPGDTPTEYRQWVERCWAQDPCDRPNAGSVILVHDKSTEESTDTDGSFLDLGSSETGLANAHSRSDGEFNQDAIFDNHEEYVGSLPQTDDDVVTYFCTAAVKAEDTYAQLFLGWIYCHGRGIGKSERDSFWWYRKAANGGDVVAQILLARMYEHGQEIVSRNASKAATWYRRAADGGSAEAQLALGKMYTDGYGVKEDTSEAVRWYEKAAEQGHHEAQTILGQWFALGRGVIQSDEQALRWFTPAAEQGNPAAQTRLGHMYLDRYLLRRFVSGEDTWRTKLSVLLSGSLYEPVEQTNQNLGMAVKWFTRAAKQGDANAQSNLGLIYHHGPGVEQSDVEAVNWYTKAAEQGNSVAQNNLGWMYEQGRGVDQSYIEAVKWYTKAAEQGNADAQNSLGLMCRRGRGVDQSDVEAVKWYTKAAEQGNVDAQTSLGLMYGKGRGVDQSDVEAVKWYTKAAEQGNANAQSNLGLMYHRGRGVEQSDVEAVKWYTKAAEQGNTNAQTSLGWMYSDGQGVEQSHVEAVKWFTKAAEQGNAPAQTNLGWCYDLGRGVVQCDVGAAKWYSRSAAQHEEFAQFNIASMYELGLAVDRKSKGPLHLYQEAAANGEPDAHFHVQWLTSPTYLDSQATTDAQHTFTLYSRGAEQGYAAAQQALGRMYERGLGVAQDAREAIIWYSKAAARGHTDTKQRMEFLQDHLD